MHFETKFLNRQEMKKKSEKTGEKSGRKTVKMTDEGLESDRRIYVREFCVKLKYLVEFSK